MIILDYKLLFFSQQSEKLIILMEFPFNCLIVSLKSDATILILITLSADFIVMLNLVIVNESTMKLINF